MGEIRVGSIVKVEDYNVYIVVTGIDKEGVICGFDADGLTWTVCHGNFEYAGKLDDDEAGTLFWFRHVLGQM